MQLTKVQQRIVDILREKPDGCPLGVLELKLTGETLPTLMESLNALKAKKVIAYGAHGVHLDDSYLAAQMGVAHAKRPAKSVKPELEVVREKAPVQQRHADSHEVASAAASRKKANGASPSKAAPAVHLNKRASTSSVADGFAEYLVGVPKRGVALCERSPITLLDLIESQRNVLKQLDVDTVGELVRLLDRRPLPTGLDRGTEDGLLRVLRDAARNVSHIRARLYLGALGEIGPCGLFFNAFGALCVLVGEPKGYLPRQDDDRAQAEGSLPSVIDAVLWTWALPCEEKRQKALVAAIAMYMHARNSRFSLEDQSDPNVVEHVLTEYFGSEQLTYSCAALAHAWHEECAIRYKSGLGLPESLRIASSSYWTGALDSLHQTCGPDFTVSADGKSVRFAPKTLDAWLHSMEDVTSRVVFMSLLRGDTLGAIEGTVGVTKRELKKIICKELEKAPVLMEDCLLARVKTERPSFEELSEQTRADARVNRYLHLRYANELGNYSSVLPKESMGAKKVPNDEGVRALASTKSLGAARAKTAPAVKKTLKWRLEKAEEKQPQKMKVPVVMVEERAEEWSHQETAPVQEPSIVRIENVTFTEQGIGGISTPVTRDSALAALGLDEKSVRSLGAQDVHTVGRLFEVLKEKDAKIGPCARRSLLEALKRTAFPVAAAKAVPLLTARGKRRPGGFYFNPFGLLCVAPAAAPRPARYRDVDRRAPILTSKLDSQAIGVIGTPPELSAKLMGGGLLCVSDLYGRNEHQLVSACGISLDDAAEVLRLFDAYLSESGCIISSIPEKDQLPEGRQQIMEIAPERLNALDSAIAHLKLGCSDDDLRCLYSVLLPEVRRLLTSSEEDHERNPSIWLNVLVSWFGGHQLEQTCLAMMENWRTTCLEADARGEAGLTFRMADVPFWRAAAEEFSRKHEGEILIEGCSLLLRASLDAPSLKTDVEECESDEAPVAQMVVDALVRVVRAPAQSMLLALASVHEAGSAGACAEQVRDKTAEGPLDVQGVDDALACVAQAPSQTMRSELDRVGKDEPESARDGDAIGTRTGEGDACASREGSTSGYGAEREASVTAASEPALATPVRSRFGRLLSAVFQRRAGVEPEGAPVVAPAERAQMSADNEKDGAREAREDRSGTVVVRSPDGTWRVLNNASTFIAQGGQASPTNKSERDLRRAARAQSYERAKEERAYNRDQLLLHERERRKKAQGRKAAQKPVPAAPQEKMPALTQKQAVNFSASDVPSGASLRNGGDTAAYFSTARGFVPRNRDAILMHVLREQGKAISIAELCKLYESFLSDHNVSVRDSYLGLPGERKLAISLRRSSRALMMRQAYVRYYDWSAIDFTMLDAALREMAGEDIECSVSLFIKRYPQVMQSVAAHDEDELYAIARERCSGRQHGLRVTSVPNVTFPRIPIMVCGKGDRHAQLHKLIGEMSPVRANDLAEEYERRYGVGAATVKSSFLKDFRQYLVNGRYEMSFDSFTEGEANFMQETLHGRAYIPLEFVRHCFEGAFPGSTVHKLNDANLKTIGYEISENLIVRSGIDLRWEFERIIEQHSKFACGDEGFPREMMEHSLFRSEQAQRMRELEIVEYADNAFVSAEYLRSHYGVTVSDMRSFIDAVTSYVMDEAPFTMQGLLDEGFTHQIVVLKATGEFGTEILSSVFAQGCDRTRIHSTTYGGVSIFCKTPNAFAAPNLVSKIIEREGEMDLEDLADCLKTEYGVEVSISALRQVVERADLFVATALDEMVFLNREAYSRYVQDMLEG